MPRDTVVPCSWLLAQQTSLLESGRDLHIKGMQTPLSSPPTPILAMTSGLEHHPGQVFCCFEPALHPLPPARPSLDPATGAARKGPSLKREVTPSQKTRMKEFERSRVWTSSYRARACCLQPIKHPPTSLAVIEQTSPGCRGTSSEPQHTCR